MSSWLKLAERLVSAVERLADATEAIAVEQAPKDEVFQYPRDLRHLSNREVREEFERRTAVEHLAAATIAREDLALRQTGKNTP